MLLTMLLATYFAQVNLDGSVERVIVAPQKVIDRPSFQAMLRPGQKWVPAEEDNLPGRNGWAYSEGDKMFIPPKPFNSWVFNKQRKRWLPPPGKERPANKPGVEHNWNERDKKWDEIQLDGGEAKK